MYQLELRPRNEQALPSQPQQHLTVFDRFSFSHFGARKQLRHSPSTMCREVEIARIQRAHGLSYCGSTHTQRMDMF
jgi:hypothetical protein